ncbi:glycine-rich domain-containing protein [Aetokthonos hydrillicola]|uniref:glycine-rich domain-containing protein n=1 Tax=Aetokthonos hydrillicola TaxID=1550245 RepID=UPI001FBB9BD5|nr:hypothetical protein [Aetokthonos hydrillicola]
MDKQKLNTYSLSKLLVFDQELSERISTFFYKLNKLNLQPVAKKLISFDNGHGWTAQQTESAVSLYKMFLCLHFLFPDKELIPTQEIDEVWHTHILLNTCKYIQDCHELFGYILHHQSPIAEMSGQCKPYKKATEVSQLILELFGVKIMQNSRYQLSACVVLPPYKRSLTRSACITIPKI